MKNDPIFNPGHVSIYDAIEHLQISTQMVISKLEKKPSKQIKRLFQQWERVLNYFITEKQSKDLEYSELKEKFCQSKNTELKLRIKLTQKKSKETEMIQEIQAIKDHLEEGKEMWAKQIKKIEEVMQEQERSKQKIESLYKQRLSEIDAELDDIMHIHKNRLEHSQKLGDILPALFSQEELQEEKKIALGEINERKIYDFAIKKLENASEYDINSDKSMPSMNFEDLSGTQKLVFQRLLELRKKVYKFQHDETTCSENTSLEQLPSELKSMSLASISKIPSKKLSKTCESPKEINFSVIMSHQAGIIFGVIGSEKYRNGLTNLLKSDKLSISQRENIVFDIINGKITANNTKNIENLDLAKPDNWGDMSSIHAETKEIDISQDLEHIFSKGSLSLSKGILEIQQNKKISPRGSEVFTEISKDFDGLFSKPIDDSNFFDTKKPEEKIIPQIEKTETETKREIDISKEAEFSEMSIIKDFSKNYSISTHRKMSEESKRENSILEAEEVISSRRKFSIEQREPSPSMIKVPKANLFFVPETLSRPRSNPRVVLKPEEFMRSKESSFEESLTILTKNFQKSPNEGVRKPISMVNKLPILPKPPQEVKKINVKTFRGRSLQPITQNSVRTVQQSPPTRKIGTSDNKSTSPATAIKFRMRRFKEVVVSGLKNTKGAPVPTKPLSKRPTK